ncbi:hypothetical protein [Comamonas sp. JC664]|uniref:hypothetical protein n=1 Tax=Comamonas sp. JC664 TaxID=2801917 RepID=UPI00174B627F|nr:hypothetical protein [Comamonas sp. JC664]MBL0699225.1 hypothetical protein [Comamonas sp. JC664]GHH02120.1 hypothetical protein GCM10012319_70380 [Comamonas sp. KCTC 72670]
MVTIKIIQNTLTSGAPFSIRVLNGTLSDVTFTLEVEGQARDFAMDGCPPQPRITLRVPGGVPTLFQVENWGTAAVGSQVTLCAETSGKSRCSKPATVGA